MSQRTSDYVYKLVELYSVMIYRIALSYTGNRYDAEDVMQEVFLRYISSDKKFESSEHEKAWFIRVTVNCSKSVYSSSKKKQTLDLEQITELQGENGVECCDEAVYNAVMALPPKQRLCIHLFYYEDMSIKDISKKTGFLESTVKSHLRRAKATLAQVLKTEENLL